MGPDSSGDVYKRQLFIQHLPDNGVESLKRLENKEARNFYSMMFEWRVKNKSYAEMISLFVGYWHQLYKKDRNVMVYVCLLYTSRCV